MDEEAETGAAMRGELHRLRSENAELLEGAGVIIEACSRRVVAIEAQACAMRAALEQAHALMIDNGIHLCSDSCSYVLALSGEAGLDLEREIENCRRDHARQLFEDGRHG